MRFAKAIVAFVLLIAFAHWLATFPAFPPASMSDRPFPLLWMVLKLDQPWAPTLQQVILAGVCVTGIVAALLAFAYIKRWLCQVVANEFQTGVARMRRDRENGRKGGLQTLRTTLCRRDSLLQEITEGVELGRQKVRYLEHRFTLRKTFANALFLGK